MVGKTLVIGFGHKARHGKDSAARFIHEAYPSETKVYSFAAALKAYCRVAHGMTTKDAPLLQRVGLEMRQANPDFWVDILRWQLLEEQPEVALIPDVRFPNEVAFCDAAIKVTRWVQENDDNARGSWDTLRFNVPYVAQDRPADHPSETALDGFDGWADEINARDGSLSALREFALDAYDVIRLNQYSGFYATTAAQEAA